MNLSDVIGRVERISQELVLADREDPDTFAGLAEQFGEAAAVLREMELEIEAQACGRAAAAAGTLEGSDPAFQARWDALGETVNTLLSCLHGECPAAAAAFPDFDLQVDPADEESPTAVDLEVEQAPAGAAGPAAPTETEEAEQDGISLADDAIMSEFLSRQSDNLIEIEKQLMTMEETGQADDAEGLMRFFHTLKGESALLGIGDVADLCHATEDMIQADGLMACIDRLLDTKDWLVARFKNLCEEGPAPTPLAEFLDALVIAGLSGGRTQGAEADQPAGDAEAELVDTVLAESEPEDTAAAPPEPASDPTPAPSAPPRWEPFPVPDYTHKNILDGDVDLIRDFVEEAGEHLDASEGHLLTLESDPHETEALNAVFRAFHTIKGLAGFIDLEHIKEMAHKAENLLDMARRSEIQLTGGSMDLVFESVDMMKRLVEGVTRAMAGRGHLNAEEDLPILMGKLVAVTEDGADPASFATGVHGAPATRPEPAQEQEPEPAEVAGETALPKSGFIPLGNMKKKPAAQPAAQVQPAVANPAVPSRPAPAASAPAAAAPAAPAAGSKAPVKMKEAVRVDADRLDRLIETIGELVIAESMISQSTELADKLSVKLAKDLDHLDKICRELQEIGMSLRMVPVKPVFQKMARLVRDLSKKQGRKVDFVMSGEDTELDKNVVDKIGDPLVHMVRNSVDHGIEADPADRLKIGKPERGLVQLRAYHKGGNICIEIEDDGKGLDKEAILEKALSRGLVREGETLTDREIFNLIFEPGFSTAKKVTEISGRGVGMDVVRRGIEELRGTVEIQSAPGRGSVFSIRLPLTLAIIEGMVVRVAREHYIIPTLSVVRLIRPRAGDIYHVFDRGEMLAFEGSHLPLYRLGGLFDLPEAVSDPENAVVVVVEDEGRRVGLLADDLLGQQSIVIKSLGEKIQGIDGVAGGAIMSDGNVALILDVAGMVRVAHAVDTTRPLDRVENVIEEASPAEALVS